MGRHEQEHTAVCRVFFSYIGPILKDPISDYGTLTLLFQDSIGGLEVQNPHTGEFVPAIPIVSYGWDLMTIPISQVVFHI
jgi:hypothetical protein